MRGQLRILVESVVFLLFLTVLCGLAYPLALTGLGETFFARQAGGSLLEAKGAGYGSELVGQPFSGAGYLSGRVMNPDVASFKDAQGRPLFYSWPGNASVTSADYAGKTRQRAEALRAGGACPRGGATSEANRPCPVPVDLVTSSGSGLDPHISPEAAFWQAGRIARARALPEVEVRKVIEHYTEGRFLGIFGERRVNVLKVNLTLDGLLREY